MAKNDKLNVQKLIFKIFNGINADKSDSNQAKAAA